MPTNMPTYTPNIHIYIYSYIVENTDSKLVKMELTTGCKATI